MESDMPGSFEFYKDSDETRAAADLGDAKVMVYTDGGENKYILDALDIVGLDKIDDLKLSNLKDIKIKYHPKGGEKTDVQGLGNIIGKLFATKNADTPSSKTMLEEEVAKKPVAEAVLGATDAGGKKSILVEKLGTFLDEETADNYKAKYDKADGAAEQTVKDFLVSKGLGSVSADPSDVATELITNKAAALGTAILGVKKDGTDDPALETALAANKTLQDAVAGNTTFRDAVKSDLANPEAIAAVPALKHKLWQA